MTFLAFGTSNIFHRDLLPLAGSQFLVVFLIRFVIFVVVEFDLCLPMAIDTPTHAQGGVLPDDLHLLYFAMTLLAVHFPDGHVLGMVEVDMVRKVVDPIPLDRTTDLRIVLTRQGSDKIVPLIIHGLLALGIQCGQFLVGDVIVRDLFLVDRFNLLR